MIKLANHYILKLVVRLLVYYVLQYLALAQWGFSDILSKGLLADAPLVNISYVRKKVVAFETSCLCILCVVS